MSTAASHYETLESFSPPSVLGPFRAADYWKLPEGEPVELLQGRLVVSPVPTFLHQTISLLLSEILLNIARKTGGCACASPMDVVLADHTILQPDLVYIARSRRGIVQDRIEGPPDLVIEILSNKNVRRDRVDKMNLYAQFGVAEYWIVDPNERQFDFLINRDGRFEVQPQSDNRYVSPHCAALSIDLGSFWAEVDQHVSP